MNQISGRDLNNSRALKDLYDGISNWRIWVRLSWIQIKERYKRSVLGGFWVTLSTLVLIAIFGILYARLFQLDLATHLPYVAAGIVCWLFYSEVLINGCSIFIKNAQMIRQMPISKSIFLYQMINYELIIFMHNFLIIIVVSIIYITKLNVNQLAFIPALIVLIIHTSSLALIFGIISTRYRDFPPLIQAVLRPMMFLTPIIWHADMFPDRAFFIDWNPIYHIIDICRAPLLGQSASANSWYIVLSLTVISVTFAFIMFAKYRHRIAYWV